ncbi:MAG: hypothetical protein HDR15_02905 [Lachnospiraceae bacterium]|nr:hypothetical protein [Lachnospiraceae bacterium]
MTINSYTYIYLFVIFILGVVWATIMILLEKRELSKKEYIYDENIISDIINNNNTECINDYNIKNTENFKDASEMFNEFIKKDIFEEIRVG